MDTGTIIRLLKNSGFNVKGADATHLIIEDPSCIMRNFETFLGYAWVIVTLISAILLFGWAISKIRGASTDVAINIRNLLIMFAVLSATGPIINVIYGDDLIARTCHEVKIPLADVQHILDERNSRMSPNDRLFEEIDIFDSGIRPDGGGNTELEPINVPNVTFQRQEGSNDLARDPETGELIPIFDTDPETLPESN